MGMHVFLSYCHDNFSEVSKLRNDLIRAGETIWWDRDILPGKDWKQEIRRAMKGSYAVVLCLSKELTDRVKSGVYPEILDAIAAYRQLSPGSIFLIPVRLSRCEVPDIEIDDSRTLDRLQSVDLFPASKRVAGLKRLVESLRALYGHPSAHPPAACRGSKTDVVGVPIGPVFSTYPRVSLARLPSTHPDLFGRERQLAVLESAWNERTTNIVTLAAMGGTGKTALVNKWLLQMHEKNYGGADYVLGWSFYHMSASGGQKASADRFMAWALTCFDDPNPAEGSPWDKGQRLAEHIRKCRVLLILDGLEPLQYPPGEMRGHLRDPGLRCLLRELAFHNPGLCVITTRLDIDDLKDFVGASVKRVNLENLSLRAGVAYLTYLGVKGATQDELKHAVREFHGHALALTLLGRYLAVVHGGDVRKRDRIAKLTDEDTEGTHARRVMIAYEKWFHGTPERDVLYMMGLFDQAADAGAIDVLRKGAAIPGLTERLQAISEEEWQLALANLQAARLLAVPDSANMGTLDCHPLVREHFREQFKTSNPVGWREAHGRLYEYYKSATVELPDTLEDMSPLFAAMRHGCMAGRHREAVRDVGWPRICRGPQFFSTTKLGADGENLVGLSYFYEHPWTKVIAGASDGERVQIMTLTASCVRGLGRLAEAIEVFKNAHEVANGAHDYGNASRTARSLSETCLRVGRLADAERYARQGIEAATNYGGRFELLACWGALGDALHQAGRLPEAANAFEEAEAIQRSKDPRRPCLYAFQGFRYWCLLLSLGKFGEVEERAEEALKIAVTEERVLAIAHCHLIVGHSHVLRARLQQPSSLSLAADRLEKAVEHLRLAAKQDELPRGLLARAALQCECGAFDRAHHDLNEVLRSAEYGKMRLFEADAHCEYAQLHLARGDKPKARESWSRATQIVKSLGYRRLNAPLSRMEERLKN